MKAKAAQPSNAKSHPAARSRRKFDIDRSEVTRRKIFDATITCLNQVGFAATTTTLIAETAELSRGAMLHQFSSKADIIVAVHEYCTEMNVREHRRRLQTMKSDEQRLRSLLRVIWDVAKEPHAIALSEIDIGYRSDPDLAATFGPRIGAQQVDRIQFAWVRLASRIGITDLAEVEDLALVHLVAVRGLIVTQSAMPGESRQLNGAFQLLDRQTQLLIDRWIERAMRQAAG